MSVDADLQRALELSRHSNQMEVDSGISEIPGISAVRNTSFLRCYYLIDMFEFIKEEAQLQKAISASIQSTTPDLYQIVNQDPTKRKREEEV